MLEPEFKVSKLTEIMVATGIAAASDNTIRIGGESSAGLQLADTDWAKFYFPNYFTRAFTKYQQEFWDWGETITPGVYTRPRVECEPRGIGKSTNGEALAVRLMAKKVKRFCIVISRTEDKALQHFAAARAMLETPTLLRDYPHLQPHINKITNRITGWKADQIVTADGRMFMALTLESARGLKSELGIRPDLVDLDDIDVESDGPNVIAKNLNRLRMDIIPSGDIEGETLYIVLQNLIHRDSVVSQLYDGRADILSDRVFCGPFPLLKWYDAIKEDIPGDLTGAQNWRITAGETYDDAIPIKYAEALLNRMGKKAFDRECQQDVTSIGEDKDFREWDEVFHLSTWSEVVAGFHRAGAKDIVKHRIPERWEVGKGLDWGTTPGHPTVCSYFAIPDQRYPFSDVHLGLGEVVLPKFPRDISEAAEAVSPGRVAQALTDFERRLKLQDSQIKQQKMSHEASAALNTFLIDLADDIKQTFSKWKPKRGSGVPQIQNLMEIDHSKPHPFRCYPIGHAQAGQPIRGRPRFILVVDDGQGELYIDGEGKLRVIGAIDSGGQARARYEIPLYSYLNSGQNKINDDWCDSALGLHSTFGLHSAQQTHQEKIEAAIPAGYRYEDLLKKSQSPTGLRPSDEMAYLIARQEAKAQVKPRVRHFDEFGDYQSE